MITEQLQKRLSDYKALPSHRQKNYLTKGRNQIVQIHIYFSEQNSKAKVKALLQKLKKIDNSNNAINITNSSISSSSISTQHSRNYSSPTIIAHDQEIKIPRESYIISQIIHQRKLNAIKISSFLKCQLSIIKKKKQDMINFILKKRREACLFIQTYYRMFIVNKQFRKILYSRKFVFFYSLEKRMKNKYENGSEKLNSLKIKIFNIKERNKGKDVIYQLEYSKYLDQYFLPIPAKGPLKQKLFVNFLFNDQCIIDPRYDVGCNEKGEYCNIVYHSYLYRTCYFSKFKTVEILPKYKFWENIFEIKNSSGKKKRYNGDSSNSVSGISIDQYLGTSNVELEDKKEEIEVKPILKNKIISVTNKNQPNPQKPEKRRKSTKNINKKVEFNQSISFGY